MPKTNDLGQFFSRVSLKEVLSNPNVSEDEANKRASLILQALAGLLTNEPYNFAQAKETWTLTQLGGYPKNDQLTYTAATRNCIIEIVDVPPREQGTVGDGKIYSVNRVISIHDRSNPGTVKGTVFMRLSPHEPPSINVLTENRFAISGFVNQGFLAPVVVAAAQSIIDRVNEKLPVPEWVKTFDDNFAIVGNSIKVKKAAPAK